jgi:tetratricopeptide (TPR) repeat protein
MADDIRAMTAQLAAEPESLVFLDLGESLRARGQLDAAYKVVRTGLARYPELARAHDLAARILSDRGEPDRAFEAWVTALRLDPGLVPAHKGLGFLYYRARDLAAAERHLAYAAQIDPEDAGAQAALARVRAAIANATPAPPPSATVEPPAGVTAETAPMPPAAFIDEAQTNGIHGTNGAVGLPFAFDEADAPSAEVREPVSVDDAVFAGLEGGADGLLLVDGNGLRLGGGLRSPSGADVADLAAAQLAGVAREAERTARLLELGAWRNVAVESLDGHLLVTAPAAGALLLTARGPEVPMGRVARFAERASSAARAWLDRVQ